MAAPLSIGVGAGVGATLGFGGEPTSKDVAGMVVGTLGGEILERAMQKAFAKQATKMATKSALHAGATAAKAAAAGARAATKASSGVGAALIVFDVGSLLLDIFDPAGFNNYRSPSQIEETRQQFLKGYQESLQEMKMKWPFEHSSKFLKMRRNSSGVVEFIDQKQADTYALYVIQYLEKHGHLGKGSSYAKEVELARAEQRDPNLTEEEFGLANVAPVDDPPKDKNDDDDQRPSGSNNKLLFAGAAALLFVVLLR